MSLKKIFISISIFFIIFFLILEIVFPLCFINIATKKPKDGWPQPELNKNSSRAIFLDYIKQEEQWFFKQNPEEIKISSFDNLTLNAQLLVPNKNINKESPKGTIILMHGYHSRADYEFAGLYSFFFSLGYNVLLCDQRTHGKSEGKYLTFGIKERYDCYNWISYISKRFGPDEPIWLCGISMGCSTVLMTLGFDLPKNVKGVIADCGFTKPSAIISENIKSDYKIPPKIVMPQIRFWTKIICDFDIDEYSTLEALEKNKLPILFIHGINDSFVPFEMSVQNYNKCTSEKYFLSTKAKHAANFLIDNLEYKNEITNFLNKTK